MASEIALPQGSAPAIAADAGTPAWRHPWALAAWAALAVVAFWAATGTTPTAFVHLWTWLPALLRGLLANIEISVLAMALGTLAGLLVGAVSLSPLRVLRVAARWYVQVFCNAPVLVLVYFTTYVFPFELHLVSWTFPFPDWIKVVLGLALPQCLSRQTQTLHDAWARGLDKNVSLLNKPKNLLAASFGSNIDLCDPLAAVVADKDR